LKWNQQIAENWSETTLHNDIKILLKIIAFTEDRQDTKLVASAVKNRAHIQMN
jgi:hypothetical protein